MNTKKQNKKKKGFTLIELIIVIAIIAILAAIAIPNFLGIQRKSKIKADIASAKTIYDATSAAIAEGAINPEVSGQNGEFELTPGAKLTDKDITIKAIENRLQTIPTGKYTNGDFKVTITPAPNGVKPEISVSIGTTKVYPNGSSVYDINSADGAKKTS
ncbi:prepilin-type N-terminal cleavage/methylation domain-containing protein [Clostridium perfringens]|uniref:prepilin-type N-terminal cleavage/methylation domain-containing protein n=1 Tax=Clostridium perfringens TaxID=1502 RepID=UPI0024BCC00F|nr:prepilin-type N-terminal cleavage/methylation domain-containing protein [Clostridium perfringens]EGT3606347.1 prepilin-type N-terminal cleavage/methylation domain-containing protein [Clostridium perfringens]